MHSDSNGFGLAPNLGDANFNYAVYCARLNRLDGIAPFGYNLANPQPDPPLPLAAVAEEESPSVDGGDDGCVTMIAHNAASGWGVNASGRSGGD